jgi:GNAT superfamily N-acetyltransferase
MRRTRTAKTPTATRAALLYRHADRVAGYLCLAGKIVTGYRDLSAGYRSAADAERVIRPCVMVVWVDVRLRRHGVARQLVAAAARYAHVTPAGLAWSEPFTDSGYLLAQSINPDGLWIADYSEP